MALRALVLLAAFAAVAAAAPRAPVLADRLIGAPGAGGAKTAAYYDGEAGDWNRLCLREASQCGVWGKEEVNSITLSFNGDRRFEGAWTSQLACSECHAHEYYGDNHGSPNLFNPSSANVGWCYTVFMSYENIPIASSADSTLKIDGWFESTCYFGEGGEHTCLPDECSRTELKVSGPVYMSDKLLWTVNPKAAAFPPSTCNVGFYPGTTLTTEPRDDDTSAKYYEANGNIYVGSGTLTARHGPFASVSRPVWFQYAWANPYVATTGFASTGTTPVGVASAGDRVVYTPWSYTIDIAEPKSHYRE